MPGHLPAFLRQTDAGPVPPPASATRGLPFEFFVLHPAAVRRVRASADAGSGRMDWQRPLSAC